jgi:hypothetical protein
MVHRPKLEVAIKCAVPTLCILDYKSETCHCHNTGKPMKRGKQDLSKNYRFTPLSNVVNWPDGVDGDTNFLRCNLPTRKPDTKYEHTPASKERQSRKTDKKQKT